MTTTETNQDMNRTGEISFPAAGDGGSHRHTRGRAMVCLDVDGTLVDHDGHMSEEVRRVGREAVADGHTVVVSTGRSLPAVLPVVEALGITQGYAVCSNGGVTVRIDTSLEEGYEIIDRQVFDPAPALQALSSRLPNARYAVETAEGVFLSTERFQDISFGLIAEGVSFQELTEVSAVRLVVNSHTSTSEEFAAAVGGIGLQGVTYSVGWSAWLDVAAAGVTKGSSLEVLREKLEVPLSDVVAVGDGRNDIEMLAWAGLGVAMGQAPEEVVRVADEVTDHVNDDGLVPVLRRVLDGDFGG